MGKKKRPPIVLFNASVVLAGLHSPLGGSGKLLKWSKKGQIIGLIGELIIDEVRRNAEKVGFRKSDVNKQPRGVFANILPHPRSFSFLVTFK